jgi:hypothetical protein
LVLIYGPRNLLLSYGIIILILGITTMSFFYVEQSSDYQNFFREIHGNPPASELSSYKPSTGMTYTVESGMSGTGSTWSIAYPLIDPEPNLIMGFALIAYGLFWCCIESIQFDVFTKFQLYCIIVVLSLVVAYGINTFLNTFNIKGTTDAFLEIIALWFATFAVMKELIDAAIDDREKKRDGQRKAPIEPPILEALPGHKLK